MASSLPPVPRDCITCDGIDCEEIAPAHRCSNCKTVYFCSRDCQRSSWKTHRPDCRNVDEMRNGLMGLGEGAVLVSPEEASSALNTECAICLESEMKNPIVLDQCKHAFCSSCLVRWQERKRHSPFDVNTQASLNLNCPLCRCETTNVADSLLTAARLAASRANRPGCSPQEQAKFRQQALTQVQQAMDRDDPHVHAYCIKIDILIALKDGTAALECIDELQQVNQERSAKRSTLKRMIAQADTAMARGDENAEELQQAVIDQFEETGHLAEQLVDNKETRFGIELQRAEAYQVLEDWEAAANVYHGILEEMESPSDGTPPQQRQVFMGLSRCAYELKKYEQAIHGAQAAIAMNRHFPGVHKHMALSQKSMGDLDAAISTMNRAVLYETPWDEDNKARVLKLYNELKAEKEAA